MVRTLGTVYVELIRNLPLLLLITFMNLGVVLQAFPRIEDAWVPFDLFVVSNRGIAIPWYLGPTGQLVLIIFAAIVIAFVVGKLRIRQADKSGTQDRAWVYGFVVFAIVLIGSWIIFGYSFEKSRYLIRKRIEGWI